MSDKVIKFIRKKDFKFVKDLGRGGCGKAVLLYDDVIDEHFVCKKYEPHYALHKEQFFKNFLQEIKILYLTNHQNICRVFGYYIYPEHTTGYITMEYIKGYDIEDFLGKFPENFNEIFTQAIEGFSYLEHHNILHRDIRPQNIMITESGVLKIIDFGFGKRIDDEQDFDKSVSLNWWCSFLPAEFKKKIYDFRTEVYFIGKLFEKILIENEIECFKFKTILHKMCETAPSKRMQSFSEIKKELLKDKFDEIGFNEEEIDSYRNFTTNLFSCISKFEENMKYFNEIDNIQLKLEDLYKKVMLEEVVPKSTDVISCFVNGSYRFRTKYFFYVSNLRNFIDLLKSCPKEKKNIILSNIHSRLDAVERMPTDEDMPEEMIPF
jgi:serine/threonine protein kinase